MPPPHRPRPHTGPGQRLVRAEIQNSSSQGGDSATASHSLHKIEQHLIYESMYALFFLSVQNYYVNRMVVSDFGVRVPLVVVMVFSLDFKIPLVRWKVIITCRELSYCKLYSCIEKYAYA